MRRREAPRDPAAPPAEVERFRLSDWIDRAEPVPERAYEHMRHNRGATAGECECVYRAVRAIRRHLDAKRAWLAQHSESRQ